MDVLSLLSRKDTLFDLDMKAHEEKLRAEIEKSKILVIGGAGTIGQSVSVELFKRNPKALHVIDISENNMVELVRDIRSSLGYSTGEFKTYALDCGSLEFRALVENEGPYDYVFNLSAMKHVRSEKDPYTLMRMTITNIFNVLDTISLAKEMKVKNYFCVSTDKAANPANLMGASKRIMELFLNRESLNLKITMARFANVAFSDGSLLHGFNQRFLKHQPLSAPSDILRYFITPQESGELCLLSGFLGNNRDIFFPKLNPELHLTSFSDIAERYVVARGYTPKLCRTELEAREYAKYINDNTTEWPCYFFNSDTTGEKPFEEFFTPSEELDLSSFSSVGIVKNTAGFDSTVLEHFIMKISEFRRRGSWTKQQIVEAYKEVLQDFQHMELGKDLDGKM